MKRSILFSEVLKVFTYLWFTKSLFYIKLLKLIFNYVFLIVFIRGLLSFCLNKHFLLILLSLEFIIIGLFFGIFMFLVRINFELYFLIIFIIMIVSEGVLGLSILVSIARMYGNDYFLNCNLLW